jgi:hypothetical protein
MKSAIIVFLISALILSAGCNEIKNPITQNENPQPNTTNETPQPTTNETQSKSEYEIQKEECEAQGGELIPCLIEYACNFKASDAGKPCSSSSECEGECMAPPNCEIGSSAQGTCSEDTACVGGQFVENGICQPFVAI